MGAGAGVEVRDELHAASTEDVTAALRKLDTKTQNRIREALDHEKRKEAGAKESIEVDPTVSFQKYTQISGLRDALDGGAVLLLRAERIVEQARQCLLMPRRQEQQVEATWSDEEELFRCLGCDDWQRFPKLVVLSYCWISPDNPDPEGQQLMKLAEVLQSCLQAWTDIAVFMDWGSLYQQPRSPFELDMFKRALPNINVWYAHVLTWKLLMTKLPEGCPARGYPFRGWPTFERAVSQMITDYDMVLDLGILEQANAHTTFRQILSEAPAMRRPTFRQIVSKATAMRRPPCSPDHFADHVLPELYFTNGADRDFVERKYRETFKEVLSGTEELSFAYSSWGDDEASELAAAFLEVPPKMLKKLEISTNMIGDKGIQQLAKALPLCDRLEAIYMSDNEVGDIGAVCLAKAALNSKSLREIVMDRNAVTPSGERKVKKILQDLPHAVEFKFG